MVPYLFYLFPPSAPSQLVLTVLLLTETDVGWFVIYHIWWHSE